MSTRTTQPTSVNRNGQVLNVPEAELTQMFETCCELRRRGFTRRGTLAKTNWPRHYPRLLLEEAARRGMPGSEEEQEQALTNWLLSALDAGAEMSAIRRTVGIPGRSVRSKLKKALDRACGTRPAEIVTTGPDGGPGRASWREKGRLMHRPIDGAFPRKYPEEDA